MNGSWSYLLTCLLLLLFFFSFFILFSGYVSSVRRLCGFSRPEPVSPLFLSLPLFTPERLLARDVTPRDRQSPLAFHSKNKNLQIHFSFTLTSPVVKLGYIIVGYVIKLIIRGLELVEVIFLDAFCARASVGGCHFADVALATPCAGPPIVLAASPGLGAETLPFDVKPMRATGGVHAVTTTTAVHGRARNHAHTHSE